MIEEGRQGRFVGEHSLAGEAPAIVFARRVRSRADTEPDYDRTNSPPNAQTGHKFAHYSRHRKAGATIPSDAEGGRFLNSRRLGGHESIEGVGRRAQKSQWG